MPPKPPTLAEVTAQIYRQADLLHRHPTLLTMAAHYPAVRVVVEGYTRGEFPEAEALEQVLAWCLGRLDRDRSAGDPYLPPTPWQPTKSS